MNKASSLVLLGAGILLLVRGVKASDSIGSSFSRLFTGNPTDKAMWLLIGGTVACAIGATGLLLGGNKN